MPRKVLALSVRAYLATGTVLESTAGMFLRIRSDIRIGQSDWSKSSLYDAITNRFHVSVHLFSNRSQMTSKCGKNKKSDTPGDGQSDNQILQFLYSPLEIILNNNSCYSHSMKRK